MYFSERIILRDVERAKDADGFAAVTTSGDVEVWADKSSAGRTEFYRAQQSGIRVDTVFRVNSADYAGQLQVEHAGVIYDVVRAYAAGPDYTELTCARR